MKTKKFWISLLSIVSIALMGMSEGYDNDEGKSGHNGSPGEQTCAKSGCHDSFAANSGPGSVSINIPGMTNWSYVPGQTYTIEVTVAQTSRPLFGFGFEALLSSGANAGTLTAGAGSHALNATVAGNSRKTITHFLDSGLSNNSHTWSFTWVAPSTAVPVTLYAVGNAANNNGGDSGDYIYTTSQALVPVIVPNAPVISPSGTVSICSGGSASLSVADQSGVTFNWFNDAGQQVGTGTTLSVNNEDCYYVVASANGGSAQSAANTCVDIVTPDAAFTPLNQEYCLSDNAVQLSANTSGGSFTGPGVSGSSFNPASAGAGNHTIVYTVSVNGCTAQSSQLVTVNSDASSDFVPASASVCLNGDPVELIPLEAGGSFSGDGVNNNFFSPPATPGNYLITYTNGNGQCQSSSTQEIQVLDIPNASFSGLADEYCSNQEAVSLVPVTAGGVFSGPGAGNGTFSPGAAGIGVVEIAYEVSGSNGCVSTSVQNVLINQAVSPNFQAASLEVCDNAEMVELTPEASGGSFSGQGVSGNMFNPTIGAGIYTILHEIGNGSCAVSASQEITVIESLDAGFSDLGSGYCSGVDPVILIPVNFGGVFSGNGIDGEFFVPAQALVGSNEVSYTIIAENGCVSTSTQEVFVYESANSSFSGLAEQYCVNEESVELVPQNGGGFFIGNGMTGNTFSPAAAGAGEHVIIHEVDFVGCESITSDTVMVYGLPDVSITGLDSVYCAFDQDIALQVLPAGAVVSGAGISGSVFNPMDAGQGNQVIEASFTDENSCTGNAEVEVFVNPLPSTEVVLDNNVLTALQNEAGYAWIDCSTGLPIQGANNAEFTPQVTGSYAVAVDLNGCTLVSACLDVIIIGVNDFSVTESIYPNPANEFLTVNTKEVAEIRVLTIDGKLVVSDNHPLLSRRISTANLKKGIYVLQVIAGDRVESHRIVVSH